ncbi:hypothetical protein CW745_06050 [Psychromonas sp. psych-6C06]|nr:hypothetical protein CW745_06050 [Psychromonas sp. psych-6C06]
MFYKLLGSVDLSSLFLQQFVGYLYKAEPMPCGYSTSIGENAVKMVNKCCPSGSTQHALPCVRRNSLRMTKPHPVCLAQNALC